MEAPPSTTPSGLECPASRRGLQNIVMQDTNQEEQMRVEKHCSVGGDIGRDGNRKSVGKLLKITIKGRDGGAGQEVGR